ncbi:MAG: flagellar biosynthesis anti-sigma factor FlgM [Provencibacterium sp.]|jgi:anti-sigma28 factor (negative regulator of flagellin synthesis)|nr:flagellar biosynthesis anti-sigma factor FlgM [Provencibacterium sp.]
MSINFSAMNKLYGVQGSSFGSGTEVAAHRTAVGTPVQAPEKKDMIAISPQGNLQHEVNKVSKSVLRDIERLDSSNSARIEKLRAQIENHTYHVPTELLAAAILEKGEDF